MTKQTENTKSMKNNILLPFLLLFASISFSQNSEVRLTDLTPIADNNKFPVIQYSMDPKVAEKINTTLQLENLYHLPNQYKSNPFEQVVYDPETSNGSVQFYDYQKITTPDNILTLVFNGEASGAYSEGFEMYYNFDLRTGKKIFLSDFIHEKGITELTKKLNLQVKSTVDAYVDDQQEALNDESSDEEEKERIQAQIEMYTDCIADIDENTIGYYQYYFKENSVTFVRGRCSNHAMRALDDLYTFEIIFTYDELRNYFSTYGSSLIFGGTDDTKTNSPAGKFYKGTINEKYPITVFISEIYSDNSLDMKYWYNKYQTPIDWNGNFTSNHFSLIEYKGYDDDIQKWVKQAEIEAELVNNKIIGTWTNLQTAKVLKIELMEY